MPDVLVLVVSLALAGLIAVVWLNMPGVEVKRGGYDSTSDSLRAVHQALMIYGFDHHGVLPGLAPDGALVTNGATERIQMLTQQNYLNDALLPGLDARGETIALLDLSVPGARRDAWRTDAPAKAFLLSVGSYQQGYPPIDDPRVLYEGVDAWSGWLIGNDGGGAFFVDSPLVTSSYKRDGTLNENDHLFRAVDGDDAMMVGGVETIHGQ